MPAEWGRQKTVPLKERKPLMSCVRFVRLVRDFCLPAAVVLFAYLQWNHLEQIRTEDLERIEFQAIHETRWENLKTGRLVIRQVSGEPFIMKNVELLVSGESIKGGKDKRFTLDVIPYAVNTDGLTVIHINEIGKIICGRMVVESCEPSDDFTVRFRYSVFDQLRSYRHARKVQG